MSVWLLTDIAMDAHEAPGHPERPDRRRAVADGVRDATGDGLDQRAVEPIDVATLGMIHDPEYLAALEALEARGGGWLDGDTYLVPGSVRAAMLAAGASLLAAIAVATGRAEVAFGVVRPPGHHASRARGSGFCLINNVAVAVAGLRTRGLAERVAIADWDVHHGDGTQALFDADAGVCYASTHQSPFYPGSGDADEVGSGDAVGTMHNRPLDAGSGDRAFTRAWLDDLVPAIEEFAPDVILVSAGFDAHRADPLADLNVTEAGFEAVATSIGALSARLGHRGVALTLEGGYDLPALRSSTAAAVRGILDGRVSVTDAR